MVNSLSRPAWWPGLCMAALTSVAALTTLSAQAQSAARVSQPDPGDPKARVPPLRYESSLTATRVTDERKPLSWREANDSVARIGGWRVYAREAQQPNGSPASTPAGARP
jgi:hypothetical protein